MTRMAEHKVEIGDTLRGARQAAGLSLKDIADRIRIRPVFLEAIEAGQFERLPALPQTIGFTRAYAKFLDVDVEQPLSRLGEEVHRDIESTDYSQRELPWSQVSRARIAYVATGAFIGMAVLGALLFDFGTPRNEIDEAVAVAESLFEPEAVRNRGSSTPIAQPAPRVADVAVPPSATRQVAYTQAAAPAASPSAYGSSPVTPELAATLMPPAAPAVAAAPTAPVAEAPAVSTAEAEAFAASAGAFATSNVYLRAEPANAGAVVGVLGSCEPLRLLGQNEGALWHHIARADGTTGWVYRGYVGDKAAGCS